MASSVLITGASGALGPHLVAELLLSEEIGRIFILMRPRRESLQERIQEVQAAASDLATASDRRRHVRLDRLTFVVGDVCQPGLALSPTDADTLVDSVNIIVHAAASTCFVAPPEYLRAVNVEGTRHALQLAERCRRLRQFLLVSTTCVAGTRTGVIDERLEDEAPDFVNGYERSKWEAERVTAAAALPVRIARLSACMGGQHTGYVHRFGAFHHSLQWLMRGLIPMVPGHAASRVDIIANDVAARWIARVAAHPVDHLEVCHVAAGSQAVPLEELLSAVIEHGWARQSGRARQFDPPLIVDRQIFELFRRSIACSGDLLFTRVLESTRAFLPALLYPKVYRTERAEAHWAGVLPHPDWRDTLAKVLEFGSAHQWRDGRRTEAAHV